MLGVAVTAAFLFWMLRWMERWLQQHLFKVGWLVTRDFRLTTVFYYVFFLPGVILHEFTLWLVAGIFNVRADRQTQFPQPQETPELRMNFVRVHPRAPSWKLTLIQFSPALAGVIVIEILAGTVLNIEPALQVMRTGTVNDVSAGLQILTSRPNFWLWMYVIFTIGNTLTPRLSAPPDQRVVTALIVVLVAVLVLAGAGDPSAASAASTVTAAINTVAAAIGVVVVIDAIAIFVLAIIENSIERITGNSASIRNGRLVARKRSEILAEREQERQRAERARQEAKEHGPSPLEGIPSIYRMSFPLPDASAAKRPVIVAPNEPPSLEPRSSVPRGPSVIEGERDAPSLPPPPRPQPLGLPYGSSSGEAALSEEVDGDDDSADEFDRAGSSGPVRGQAEGDEDSEDEDIVD
ncbi:MAG: hypothetical protein IPM16_07165 [Chloroflexi bacterium]|nr:hypothetical protein [Chloroflexota bacterium]